MIVVTGATGQLGTKIVDQLLALVPAPEIGVSVRDVGRAAGLAERGVRVRRGDFNEPESLAGAFEGASRVLVISSNETGADAVAQHVAAIDAARAAGAERVLYTSHQASATDSRFAPMPDHARTEAYLREQGGAFTSLRNGFYTSTVGWLVGQAATTGTLVAPADGPVSWTTHDDLAEAAAIALADDGRLDGITAPLTAPEAIDLEAVAAILSDLVGRTVTRVVVDDEEYRATMIAHGAPEQRADFLLGLFAATRRGEFDVTDPTLERLLDRPALSVRAVLARLVGA
jgi:uncharacterized protein YbjT (DUF2867 family)